MYKMYVNFSGTTRRVLLFSGVWNLLWTIILVWRVFFFFKPEMLFSLCDNITDDTSSPHVKSYIIWSCLAPTVFLFLRVDKWGARLSSGKLWILLGLKIKRRGAPMYVTVPWKRHRIDTRARTQRYLRGGQGKETNGDLKRQREIGKWLSLTPRLGTGNNSGQRHTQYTKR